MAKLYCKGHFFSVTLQQLLVCYSVVPLQLCWPCVDCTTEPFVSAHPTFLLMQHRWTLPLRLAPKKLRRFLRRTWLLLSFLPWPALTCICNFGSAHWHAHAARTRTHRKVDAYTVSSLLIFKYYVQPACSLRLPAEAEVPGVSGQ